MLVPPKPFSSWLDYAVAKMPTRDLYNQHVLTDDDEELAPDNRSPWPSKTSQKDFADAAEAELEALRVEVVQRRRDSRLLDEVYLLQARWEDECPGDPEGDLRKVIGKGR